MRQLMGVMVFPETLIGGEGGEGAGNGTNHQKMGFLSYLPAM